MTIKVLGTGCANCKILESNTREAVLRSGITAEVIHIGDISKMLEYNVIRPPALVIDEKLAASGKVLSVEEIMGLIRNHNA